MKVFLSIVALVGVASVHSLPWEIEEEGETRAATCNCGWVNKGRIVGGAEARKNQYPLIVAIEDNYGSQFCGGTILTEWHVITAAHCTEGQVPSDMRVRVGVHDLRRGEGVVHRIARIVDHERYSGTQIVNDISLLVTQTKISFNQNVGPACLPSSRLSLTGQSLKALGWGNLWDSGRPADTLQEVDLRVITFPECLRTWRGKRLQPREATNMCTYEVRKDTCQGDSGGPLVWLNPKTNRLTLAALVSYGGDCAGNQAAPNTDVSAFVGWINQKIKATKPGVSACVKE